MAITAAPLEEALDPSDPYAREAQTFPHLTPQMLARLAPYGHEEPGAPDQHPAGLVEELLPQLLGDERGYRVQEMQRLGQRPRRGGARFRLGLGRFAGQQRLRQLDVPVAERIPQEMVEAHGGVVEPVGFQRPGDRRRRLLRLADDPAVERMHAAARIEGRIEAALVQLDETRGVPQLGDEVAVAL